MPRKQINYSKAVIYKLCCKDVNVTDIYVGCTTDFTVRKNAHKTCCNNAKGKHYHLHVYQYIRSNGGWDAWEMIAVEQLECNNSLELRTRERYYVDTLHATLNKQLPARTGKQYYVDNSEVWKQYRIDNLEKITQRVKQYKIDNREKLTQYDKQYKIDNREKNTQYGKQYRIDNREKARSKILCECGCVCRYADKSTHIKTIKHRLYVANPLFKIYNSTF